MSPGFLVVSTYHSAKIGDCGKAAGDFLAIKTELNETE
jgi:hypothetical protein